MIISHYDYGLLAARIARDKAGVPRFEKLFIERTILKKNIYRETINVCGWESEKYQLPNELK